MFLIYTHIISSFRPNFDNMFRSQHEEFRASTRLHDKQLECADVDKETSSSINDSDNISRNFPHICSLFLTMNCALLLFLSSVFFALVKFPLIRPLIADQNTCETHEFQFLIMIRNNTDYFFSTHHTLFRVKFKRVTALIWTIRVIFENFWTSRQVLFTNWRDVIHLSTILDFFNGYNINFVQSYKCCILFHKMGEVTRFTKLHTHWTRR